jgi:hypothetical protein
MTKKMICSMALFAASTLCVQSAPAQSKYQGTPKPAISDYGPFTGKAILPSRITPPQSGNCGNPATKCLFYGGDFSDNALGPNIANGLANETDSLVSGTPYGAATWVPFTVPSGQTWDVTGLFSNNLSTYGVLDEAPLQPTAAAYWEIMEDVEPGNAGTVVASGTNAATATPTGRAAFDLTEYTVQVESLSVTLTAGTYWFTVVPICTNSGDPYCDGVFFATDVEYINALPKNAVGPAEPSDLSYFDSSYFGETFDPTNGPLGACAGIGCDAFSAGVLGTGHTKK